MNEEATEITRRPIWQTRPCPPWCISVHRDADDHGSRECLSEPAVIGLKLMETLLTRIQPDAEAALDTLLVTIEQGDGRLNLGSPSTAPTASATT
jgi:hypothetical protein